MSRVGMPEGTRSTSVLYLPMRNGEHADRSPAGQSVSYVGTLPRYSKVAGMFGDAIRFSAAGTNRLVVASHASLNFSGAFSWRLWYYPEESGTSKILLERAGAWSVFARGQSATFAITDSGGTSLILFNEIGWPWADTPRWIHLAGWFEPGVGAGLLRDGALVAYTTTTLANVKSAGLGAVPLTVGGRSSSQFTGRLEDVHVLAGVAETSTADCSPNLRLQDRDTRRQVFAYDLELPEHTQGYTWTADGSGGYYLPRASLTLGSLIVSAADVAEVKATTGSTATTFTQQGNVTDLDAASSSWFWDEVNGRLYSSEDPSTYDVFAVTVRVGAATKTTLCGTRTYRGAVEAQDAGERRMAFLDEEQPTGGGGQLTIAQRHPDWPAAWATEHGGSIAWPGARVRGWRTSDHLPRALWTAVFSGLVDAGPAADRDVLQLQLFHEPARFFRLPFSRGVLDRATYPDVYTKDEGQVLSTSAGRDLRRVPCYCINATYTAGIGYQYKFSAEPMARLVSFGTETWQIKGAPYFFNIDLDAGTFYTPLWPPQQGPYTVDVDGIGDAASPTSAPGVGTALPFGSSADAEVLPQDIGARLLSFIGVTAAKLGDTWPLTGARVQQYLRWSEAFASAGDVVKRWTRFLFETMTFAYYRIASDTWEWEDVNKADAVDWVVRDADVIAEEWFYDRSKIRSAINDAATAYYYDADGNLKKTQETTLGLKSDAKYQATLEPWNGGVAGHYNKASLDVWNGLVRPFKEQPLVFWKGTLSNRYAGLEQMDVVDLQVSSREVSTSRFRVLAARELEHGVETTLFWEGPFPTDGTSAPAVREAGPPVCRWHIEGGVDGIPCATGGWTTVGDWQKICQGAFGPLPPSITHRLTVEAKRIGGAADTDFQLRLRDQTSGLVIATIAQGYGTSAGWKQPASALTNLPSADSRLVLESLGAGGATGLVYGGSWMAAEGAANSITTPFGPTVMDSWGYEPGVPLLESGTTPFYYVEDPRATGKAISTFLLSQLLPGAKWRLVFDAEIGTATACRVFLHMESPSGGPPQDLAVDITGARGFYATAVIPTWSGFASVERYVAGGTGIVYGFSIELINPGPQ